MSSDVVRVDVSGHVAVVSLNRPEKLNAMSTAVFDGLRDAAHSVENDASVRAVLIRGEGRAFSSGLDLSSLGAIGGRSDAPAPVQRGGNPQDGFIAWTRMNKPVLAAVHGYALGAGFQLALAADIRICAEGATMSVFEITYGLVPDLGGTQLLPLLVGPARAKELIWTARRITAEEAERWGIVNRVVPADALESEARALADDLASRPPLPIGFTKELVAMAGTVPLEDGMRRELERQAQCATSADAREAIAASFEKRTGAYTGA